MTIRPTKTTGFILALATLILIPSIAAACGYSMATCGYITNAQYERTDDGTVLLAVDGTFAWGNPWSFGQDNLGIAGKKEATLYMQCDAEDEWCLGELQNIKNAVHTNTPLYGYDYYNNTPMGLQDGLREKFIYDSWNMPTAHNWQESSFLCRAASTPAGKNCDGTTSGNGGFLTLPEGTTITPDEMTTQALTARVAFLEEGLANSSDNQLEFLLELEMAFGDERLSLIEAELITPFDQVDSENMDPQEHAEVQGAGCSTAASPRSTALWAGLLVGIMFIARRRFVGVHTEPCA